MATTPKLLITELSESQASKYITINEAFRKLDVLVQATVIDKDTSDAPSGASDGDTYIVGPSPSSGDDWDNHIDDVARDENGAWKFETPEDGWVVFVQDENKFYTFQTPSSSGSSGWITLTSHLLIDTYDIHAHKEGTLSNSEVVLRYPMVRAIRMPDDFSGSQAKSGVAAADSPSAEFSIQKNGSEFGQMTFAVGATTATFNTDSSTEDFAVGDILTVVAPATADSALAGVSFTLKCTLI